MTVAAYAALACGGVCTGLGQRYNTKLRFEKDGRTFYTTEDIQNMCYSVFTVSYLGLSALLRVFGTKLYAIDRNYP